MKKTIQYLMPLLAALGIMFVFVPWKEQFSSAFWARSVSVVAVAAAVLLVLHFGLRLLIRFRQSSATHEFDARSERSMFAFTVKSLGTALSFIALGKFLFDERQISNGGLLFFVMFGVQSTMAVAIFLGYRIGAKGRLLGALQGWSVVLVLGAIVLAILVPPLIAYVVTGAQTDFDIRNAIYASPAIAITLWSTVRVGR